jgi:2-polyprenyl-6-methoxyphenol hydroxylase-like FAD-dependent oxidoreductase
MTTKNQRSVLISGASFAGLSTAYWMNRFGYKVTVVEIAPGLKKSGTPVNILERTIDIVQRMGIFEQIFQNRLTMETIEFKDGDDITQRQDHHQHREQEEYEIERDLLLHMLYDLVSNKVEFVFRETITGLTEENEQMQVTFRNMESRSFDLVFGCDGVHSTVRKLWFGEEKEFTQFLKAYFSITIVDHLLIPENTTQMYSEVGKTIMLNTYNGKTDICFAYFSEIDIPYDYRNEPQMREMIFEQFKDSGWRAKELLAETARSASFYFDKLCQVKMPSWTKGRVSLVGDAGYCPSPAAGRGGSIAIDGAAALADAFDKCNGNFEKAFLEYDRSFRPFVEQVQSEVVDFGLDMLIPKTKEAVAKRNTQGFNL